MSFRYEGSDRKALSKVSFDVNEGEILGILGPSEAGKTTLCMSLNGLIPHDIEGELHGNIEVEDRSVRQTEPQNLASIIGMIFQEPESQFVMTTVEDEIAFGMENFGLTQGEMDVRLNWVLKATHMEGYRTKPPRRLSGGQKQRVAIASALALRPRILVMDEPTSELDPLGKVEVLTIAKELNRDYKITVILVEHETELIAGIIDRIMMLNHGEIMYQGTPVELFNNVKLMKETGLFVPEVTEVAQGLVAQGVSIPKLPITYDEGVSLLKQFVGK